MASILLVDDDADTRSLLSAHLTGEGFVVHTARDGRHAFHVLERIELPDLILLDYRMPVMNGVQFLAERRANDKLRPIPVIVLSAWTREWVGAGLGESAVIAKPVDLDQLSATVNRVLIAGPAPEQRVMAR